MAELRLQLTSELSRLERSLPSTAQAARPVELDQTTVGRLSRIDALQTQHLTRDLHSRALERQSELTAAIERIDQGTYGICVSCRAPLAYGRLIVFPEARTCAACAARA